METLISVIGALLRQLVLSTVLASIGWATLKCATLGHYPRTVNPRNRDCADFMLLEVVGVISLAALVALLAVVAWLAR